MIDCIKLNCEELAVDNSNYCVGHREEMVNRLIPVEPVTGKSMMEDLLRWLNK